jgi:hypothetical protein
MTSSSLRATRSDATRRPLSRPAVLDPSRLPYILSGSLAVVATAAALLSFLFPSLLTGSKVATGNLRGTALAILVVGLPVLVTAMRVAARGSARGLVVWVGTLAYLLYQAVLFCFATPLNNLFLVYVAYLGLCFWSLVTLLLRFDLAAFEQRLSARMPARPLAGVALTLVVLNAYAWLSQIVPATFSSRPGSLMKDTGLLTNPVFIQDLAIWLPVLTAAGIASWNRKPWGLLVTGAMLVMFVLESISIATDQWFGSQAAPLSESASMSAVPAFAVLALLTAVPLLWYCQYLDRR